jgi:6-phosphogluconate dehydrogenase
MKLGFIGLGKMGSRMALKLLKEGHDVVVWNRSPQAVDDLQEKFPGVKSAATIKELIQGLDKSRIVWLMQKFQNLLRKKIL